MRVSSSLQEIRAHYCYDLNCFGLVQPPPPPGNATSGAPASPLPAAATGAPAGDGTSGSTAGAAAGATNNAGATVAVHDETSKTLKEKFGIINTLYNSIWLVFGCIAAFSSGIFASRLGRCGILALYVHCTSAASTVHSSVTVLVGTIVN